MVKVNIPKCNPDPSFRYKRDVIEIVIHNNNGGITKLNNIDKISEQLGCQIDDIVKFIQKKSNTGIIKKDGIFLRKIDTVDNLEIIIEEYIKKEVLCPKCNNPEFNVDIQKKKTIKTCKACGHTRESN
jgi:translation initiation factor 5